MITKEERMNMLTNSYSKHVKGIDYNPQYIFNKISKLPFNDCLVQYDSDGWIDVTTYYCNNITIIINIDVDDSSHLFTIYKGSRTLIRHELPLEDIIKILTLKVD